MYCFAIKKHAVYRNTSSFIRDFNFVLLQYSVCGERPLRADKTKISPHLRLGVRTEREECQLSVWFDRVIHLVAGLFNPTWESVGAPQLLHPLRVAYCFPRRLTPYSPDSNRGSNIVRSLFISVQYQPRLTHFLER